MKNQSITNEFRKMLWNVAGQKKYCGSQTLVLVNGNISRIFFVSRNIVGCICCGLGYIYALILHMIPSFFLDPLGIVVYNDLPDGACFNRTLATRDSARSCPPSSTSTTSMMLNAKTLQSKPKSMAASKPSRLHRPTTLRPRPPPSETFIYETVDKPAQVSYTFSFLVLNS